MVEVSQKLASGGAADSIIADALGRLEAAGFAVDYLALVDGRTMQAIAALQPGARLIVAARLGTVRLIDNIAA
jgi:pantoate--beta-alanine ligase